jgi:protein TonB
MEAPPSVPVPPVAAASPEPPVSQTPETPSSLIEKPPRLSAPIELAPPPKPQFSPQRAPPKPQVKPATKPIPKAEPAQGKLQQKPIPAGAPQPSYSGTAAASAAAQSAYISAMSAAIRSRLFYPPAARARGAKGVVSVAFTIDGSGALSSFAITRSSGDQDLDSAARTLVQSAHFPPPPAGPVHVSTSFNYVPR